MRFWLLVACGFLIALLIGVIWITSTIGGATWVACTVDSPAKTSDRVFDEELCVVTLNIAHGRKQAAHQFFESAQTLENNLTSIAKLIQEQDADIIGFQEIDRPSFWTSNQNQPQVLGETLSEYSAAHGAHVDGFGLHYGTAVFSRLPMSSAYSGRFDATPPTFPKGFVVARIEHPQLGAFDFVSVHLDFASSTRRRAQLELLGEKLTKRDVPRIVVGDFNCEWNTSDSPLPEFCESLKLHAWKPDEAAVTFPATGARLDWIFISDNFEFSEVSTLSNAVSDHRAVVARICPVSE